MFALYIENFPVHSCGYASQTPDAGSARLSKIPDACFSPKSRRRAFRWCLQCAHTKSVARLVLALHRCFRSTNGLEGVALGFAASPRARGARGRSNGTRGFARCAVLGPGVFAGCSSSDGRAFGHRWVGHCLSRRPSPCCSCHNACVMSKRPGGTGWRAPGQAAAGRPGPWGGGMPIRKSVHHATRHAL
jgi:hypothetical protein